MYLNNISMDGIKLFYNTIIQDKRKERFEMILEPLQGMVQIAMLSFCPVGSKLSITSNILTIQEPSWSQSLSRSYNKDGRDDLVYLFNVIVRFNKFYQIYFKDKPHGSLFKLLTELSMKGIDILIQTYSNSGHGSLIQSLRMYKSIMEKSDMIHIQKDIQKDIQEKKEDIDEIFVNIREIYDIKNLTILHNLLLLMKEDTENYISYMKAVNNSYSPINSNIQKWIHEHIAF